MNTNREMRIVFMGTPDFAVATLKALIDYSYNIVGVITAPDRPSGRGQRLKPSAVKQLALEHNLKVLQPTNLKSEAFIEELQELRANLQIVVAFRMLPKIVWQMPKYGTFNLHASILPNYRGAAPIHWAIINGEQKTGVTTFFIDEKIDTGAIILTEEVDIGKDDTVGQLHDRLMVLGSHLVIETVKQIETNTVNTTIQPKLENLKTAYKLNRNNCKINWTEPVDIIYNKIRGLNPFPAAWCYLDNGSKSTVAVKLFKVTKIEAEHNIDSGQIKIEGHEMHVACPGGFINVLEFQLPNKKRLDTKSVLNGFEFHKTAKLL